MNIYLTGAHSTGKSTVAQIIKERTGFCTVPSVSRNSPYEMGTEEHQRYVMDKVFYQYSKYDGLILERSPLDVYAYTKLMQIESEYGRQKMKVEAFFRGIGHSDSPIFYFPIYFDLEHDGIRPGQEEQVEIDKFIVSYLQKNNIDYYTIPDTTPEERADFILERVAENASVRLSQ